MTTETEISFADIGLSADILTALDDLGYEKPSPIQQQCIPHLLAGRDVWVWHRQVVVKRRHSACRY